jgi:hypothetical protein
VLYSHRSLSFTTAIQPWSGDTAGVVLPSIDSNISSFSGKLIGVIWFSGEMRSTD